MMRHLLIVFFMLQALHILAGDQPNICFIGKPQTYMEVAYLDELEAHGFVVESATWNEITPHVLRRFNAIVITAFQDETGNVEAGVINGLTTERQRLVSEYMKAGGGVLVYLNTVGCYGKEKLGTVPEWLATFGITFLAEAIVDKSRAAQMETPSLRPYSTKAAWTESFATHPVTAGVRSLWYPTGWGGHAMAEAVPVIASHQWTTVVETSPEAELIIRDDVWSDLWRAERPGGPHALMAVGSFGSGRMAVLGGNPVWTVWTPYHEALGEIIMKKGQGGKPSDFWRLLENTYNWLAEPSLQMGVYGIAASKRPPVAGDTAALDWAQLTMPEAPKRWYRGTVGARTALSVGKGSVAEWAGAAQQAGFDFIVFAEALEAMNAEKWETLKNACLGATSESFVAYPGLTYRNAAGTHGFAPIGYVDWFPADWLTPDGSRINIDRGWSPQKGWGATQNKSGQIMMFLTYWKNGYYNYDENPSPFWDYKLYDLMPIWTFSEGKLLEENLAKYLQVCAAHHNPAAYTLDLMSDPAELAGAIAAGRPHLVVPAVADPRAPEPATLQNVFNRFVVDDCAYKLGTGAYRGWQGPAATTGPALRWMFRGGYRWEGVEFPRYWIERHAGVQPEDWYLASWYRLKLRVDAASDVGLRELTIYDGEQVLRRYALGDQPEASIEFSVVQAPTRHLIAVVTDSQGRQAVAREIWMEQQMNLYNYCGDRVNVPISIYSPIHGHPYPGFDKGHEARRFYVDLVSPDLLIERYSTDAVYRHEELSDTFGWHNWAPHYERENYTFDQRGFAWYDRHGKQVSYGTHPSQNVHWDGFTVRTATPEGQLDPAKLEHYENMLTLKQPYPLDDDGFLPPSLIAWPAGEEPLRLLANGAVTELKADSPPQALAGESILSLGQKSVRIIGDDWFAVRKEDSGKTTWKIGLRPSVNETGTILGWGTEQLNRAAPEPTWFQIQQGVLRGQPLVELHVDAVDGAAVAMIRQGASDFNCQPIVVHGVSRGSTAGYYEKETGRYRPIGVLEGKAYAQLPSSQQATTVVIGNLVRAEHPEITIEMIQQTDAAGLPTGEWLLDAHNPTTDPIDTRLNFPAAFAEIVQTRHQQISLPAGGSVAITIR